ncbi:MAG: hypothetical protein HY314_16145 [Acidobacteria bacterium]|nr:hypothetical protein [Acidobacteriota bacterium]
MRTVLAIEKTNLPARYRSTMIVILAFLGSVLLYMLLAYVMALSTQPSTLPASQQATLVRVVYGIAFLLGIGVILGRRAVFNASRLMRLVEKGGLNRLVGELASKTILFAALSEAIALLGLILSLLTKSYEAMWRLGAVGVLLLLYNMPRRSAWERTVENFSRFVYEE